MIAEPKTQPPDGGRRDIDYLPVPGRLGRPMTDLEFQGLVFDWATDARNYVNEFLASDRFDSTEYYRGKLPDVDLDTAQEDRSRAVLTEVRDTVLGMMPELMRIFFSGDGTVEFQPVATADPIEFQRRDEQAQQATRYFNDIVLKIDNPDSFLTFHDVFQDALVRKTGFVRWQWERSRKPVYSTHTGLTEQQAMALAADPGVTVIGQQTYPVPGQIGQQDMPPAVGETKERPQPGIPAPFRQMGGLAANPPGLMAAGPPPQMGPQMGQLSARQEGLPAPSSMAISGTGGAGPAGAAPAPLPSGGAEGLPGPPGPPGPPDAGPSVVPDTGGPAPQPLLYDLKIRRIVVEGRLRLRGIPCEAMIVARRGTAVDRTSLLGYTEDKTVGDFIAEGWVDDPAELLDCDMDMMNDSDNWETQARRPQLSSMVGPADNPAADPSMRIIKYGELYVTADRDGDGIPELIRVITAGTQYRVLDEQPCDDIPFSCFCPYPEAFQFFGQSVTDLTKDIQRIKSRILRDTLDSLAQSVQPQMGVVEGQVNLDDALNPDTSKIVRMRQPGMMQPIVVPFVGKEALPVLELLDEVREGRTGVSDATAGLDPAVMQSTTKAAVQATLTRGQARIELVARIFAESGMVRLFRGMLRETIRHQDQARMTLLNGKPVNIDPAQWHADMAVTPTLVLGRGSQQDQTGFLTQILQKQEQILQQLGPQNPIVSIDQYAYTLRKLVELAGWRNTLSFFQDPSQMDPAAKQQMLQQMASQMAQGKGQGKTGPDPQIEQMKIASQEKQAQMKMQMEQMKEQNALQLEVLKMKAQHMTTLLQMQADHQQAVDQAAVDQHAGRFNQMLDAHVTHMGNLMNAHVTHQGNLMDHAAKMHAVDARPNGKANGHAN
jgi:hypothetical protein